VDLNHAMALAMYQGLGAGLALLEELEQNGTLQHYHLFHVAKADLLRREGRLAEAADAYQQACSLAENGAERAFLERRLAQLRQESTGAGENQG